MGTRKLKVIIRDTFEEDYKPRRNTVRVFIEARYYSDYAFPVEEDETMLEVSQDVDEHMLVQYLIDQDKDNVWFYIDPMCVKEVEVFFRGLFEQYVDNPG
jgi:hypothetical protein